MAQGNDGSLYIANHRTAAPIRVPALEDPACRTRLVGGLAVVGDALDFAETQGSRTSLSYSKFIDLYDADGHFLHRLRGKDLQLNLRIHTSWASTTPPAGAYFRNDKSVVEADIRQHIERRGTNLTGKVLNRLAYFQVHGFTPTKRAVYLTENKAPARAS